MPIAVSKRMVTWRNKVGDEAFDMQLVVCLARKHPYQEGFFLCMAASLQARNRFSKSFGI